VLKLGNISVDGSKIHADASKSHAVSYGRLLELEQQLSTEVKELMELGEKTDEQDLPEGLKVDTHGLTPVALKTHPFSQSTHRFAQRGLLPYPNLIFTHLTKDLTASALYPSSPEIPHTF
jgi:hypothetical protein